MRTLLVFLVLLHLLVGCRSAITGEKPPMPTVAPPTEPVEATPTPIALQFQNGNLIRLDLPPDARPTDAAPTMTVAGLITDAGTGALVKGAVYLGDNNLIAREVDQFTLVLPGELEEWLIVKAEGYHDWKVRMRYRVLHHKNLQVPVQLTPLTQPAPPANSL